MGDPREDLLHDHRLTAAGLMMETHAGLLDVFEPELAARGLSASSFEVLLRLARSPDRRLRMAELAAQSTLTSSGLTRLVDRLEAAGLVARQPCQTDRRGFYATLTEHGLETVVAVLPSHLATIERVLVGVLEPDELGAFLGALRKVRAIVKPGSDPAVAARA
jgi:DNA-binding MarR family transcriptional regulator